MEVGGQRIGVPCGLTTGYLTGEQLHLATRHQLHNARPAIGGVTNVASVGLLRIAGLELRRVVVAPGDLFDWTLHKS